MTSTSHEEQFYCIISRNAQCNYSATCKNHKSGLCSPHTAAHKISTTPRQILYIINENHLPVSRNRDKCINHSPDCTQSPQRIKKHVHIQKSWSWIRQDPKSMTWWSVQRVWHCLQSLSKALTSTRVMYDPNIAKNISVNQDQQNPLRGHTAVIGYSVGEKR